MAVGRITLSLTPDDQRFTYVSEHVFAPSAAKATRRFEFTEQLGLPTAAIPEALWLWKAPALGCVLGMDERTKARGELCAERWTGHDLTGRLFRQRFTAHYEQGELASLVLPSGRFVRTRTRTPVEPPVDPFASGLPVKGAVGRLALSPPWAPPESPLPLLVWELPAARLLAMQLRAEPQEGAEATCVTRAKRFVQRAHAAGHDAVLVVGLVVDAGRAYPHAWVRVRDKEGSLRDLEATLPGEVTPESHLVLAVSPDTESPLKAGELYVSLYSGKQRVIRRGGMAPRRRR